MSWFAVGGALGVVLCLFYIISLFVPKSRVWLAENVFHRTIYGDILEYVDQDETDLISLIDLSMGIFVVLLCTILLCIAIYSIAFILSYILLFILILFVSAFIISSIIRSKKTLM